MSSETISPLSLNRYIKEKCNICFLSVYTYVYVFFNKREGYYEFGSKTSFWDTTENVDVGKDKQKEGKRRYHNPPPPEEGAIENVNK